MDGVSFNNTHATIEEMFPQFYLRKMSETVSTKFAVIFVNNNCRIRLFKTNT